MQPPRIVLDTSVLVAGLRSSRGASFRLLSLLGSGRFTTCASVPLILEYEYVLKRGTAGLTLTDAQVDAVLDYLCAQSEHHAVYFLWRPHLRDPGDDFVLELAVAANVEWIVTHNLRDFAECVSLGVKACTPGKFLNLIGDSA